MTDGRNCECCSERQSCEEIYSKLGGAKGASVALSVVIVFLSPLLVFILFLAGVDTVVSSLTGWPELGTGLGLFTAVAGTLLWILAARVMHRRLSRNQ